MNKMYLNTLLFTFKATGNIGYLTQAKKLIEKMIKTQTFGK